MATSKKKLDAEIAGMLVPSLGKWSMHAGGTFAAPDRHGYTHRMLEGTYYIQPISSPHNSHRHIGYSLKFSATGRKPKGGHSGLWHDLGMHRSAVAAVEAAKKHYAASY